MNWWKRRSHELRTVGLETIKVFALPFVRWASTTWSMVRHPVRFGQFVNEDLGGLAGGLAYLARAVLILLIVTAVTFRWLDTMDHQFPNFPFIEVVVVGTFVGLLLVFWLAFAPFFRLISGKELNVYPFVTASSYWFGLLIIFISLVFLVIGVTIDLFCGVSEAVYNHCEGSIVHIKFQRPGWNNLTAIQIVFLISWIATLLFFLCSMTAITSATCGLVYWLSKAHEVSKLRVVAAMLVYQVCFLVFQVCFLYVSSLV